MQNQYVEMICQLAEQTKIELVLPENNAVKPLHTASNDQLYQCYYEAFAAGDAQFFFAQTEPERREFFDTLEMTPARREPTSLLLEKDGRIVAFTAVLPYGEANCHISCMCVLPGFQGQGLGRFMLDFVKQKAAAQGYRTITLGTDTNMVAFQLYCKHGFKVVEDRES